ncbi:pectinesterase 3-like [Cornus florida]|uniref:pectinesterase 3-like n=1 Tax=Cornus florida TaxID=4283 RepID=UPI0028A21959|nr:pectinesterase 3-like [Cornus florida]
MDPIKSIKAYCKVDEHDKQAFWRKTIITVGSLVLGVLIIGVIYGVKKNSNSNGVSASPKTPSASIKAVCNVTLYPDSCFKSISALEASNPTTDPKEIFKLSLHVALNELVKVSALPDTLISKISDEPAKKALIVCRRVFEDAVDSLNDTISLMAENDGEKLLSPFTIEDARTWLSAALAYLDSCLDGLQEVNATTLYHEVNGLIENSVEFSSNSLAIVTKVLGTLSDYNIPAAGRKLLGFPEWVSAGDRRLLQETKLTPSVTVAQDGSGDVKTIKEAVARIPVKSKTRFVIYVKAGKYMENVTVEKYMWNVMIYGDGKGKTIISDSVNVKDGHGITTFSSATFGADGRGFFAKDITFENTAGPQKDQAVALRSSSNHSVFYRCSFDGFQDTLYAHSKVQFYRDCDITGTVDFIFGHATVVFQNCKIQPRQPMENQYVTITAAGHTDPNMKSGISIQKCSITPLDKLTAQTYLGRPWKDHAITVIMQTYIGSFVNRSGWIEWVKGGAAPPKTIFYGEFNNFGLGANTTDRVKWAGYNKNLTIDQAKMYTVEALLQGSHWLPAKYVFYEPGL